MTKHEWREYLRLYNQLASLLAGDLPYVRKVFWCIPYQWREHCRSQLGTMWQIAEDLGYKI